MAAKTLKSMRLTLIVGALGILGVTSFLWFRPWIPHNAAVVRIGYLPIYSELPLFVALEKEFERRGVKVEPHPFQTSPDMAAALVGNRIDAAASMATASALATESRDPGRFHIFLVDAENPENYLSSLMVRGDSPITSPKGLFGKTIGSFPGPTATVFAPLALSKLGLVKGSYRLIPLPIENHQSALASGKIDAVVTYEPTGTEMELKFRDRKLVPALIESNVINPWQAGVWVLSRTFIHDHPATSRAFVQSIYSALDLLRTDPDGEKRLLTKYTTIGLDVALRTPNIPFTKVYETDFIALQKEADLLVSEKSLSRRISVKDIMMVPSELPHGSQ